MAKNSAKTACKMQAVSLCITGRWNTCTTPNVVQRVPRHVVRHVSNLYIIFFIIYIYYYKLIYKYILKGNFCEKQIFVSC